LASTGTGGPGQSPAPAPASEPLVFGGRTFATRDELDHFVSSASGRHKTLEQKTRELEARASEAVRVANAWYEFRQGGQGQGSQPQGAQPGAQPAKPAEPEKPWADTIDYAFAEEIAAEKGLKFALYYMAQEHEKRLNAVLADVDKRIEGSVQPFAQRHQQSQLLDETYGTIREMAALQSESGAFLFPEFRDGDPAIAQEVIRIWTALPTRLTLNPETRQLAMEHAIYKFREQHGWPGRSAAPGNGAPATSGGASSGVLRAAERAAQGAPVLDGSGTPRPNPIPPGMESPQAALQRELDESASRVLKTKDGISLGVRPAA